MQRSDTQSISIDAPREAVLALVSDPTAFPRWASGFARAVRVDGPDWLVETGEGEGRLHVPISREHGTGGFLSAASLADAGSARFLRVVPNGRGFDLVLTRFFPDAMAPNDVDDAGAVV